MCESILAAEQAVLAGHHHSAEASG
jgi:hypothetical protein